jgi:hypothetical protein
MRRRSRGASGNDYRPGDHYRICDLSGQKVHASDTVKLWNGLIVQRSWYEARNPQDFVRGVADRQIVPDPRPEAADVFRAAGFQANAFQTNAFQNGVGAVTSDDL